MGQDGEQLFLQQRMRNFLPAMQAAGGGQGNVPGRALRSGHVDIPRKGMPGRHAAFLPCIRRAPSSRQNCRFLICFEDIFYLSLRCCTNMGYLPFAASIFCACFKKRFLSAWCYGIKIFPHGSAFFRSAGGCADWKKERFGNKKASRQDALGVLSFLVFWGYLKYPSLYPHNYAMPKNVVICHKHRERIKTQASQRVSYVMRLYEIDIGGNAQESNLPQTSQPVTGFEDQAQHRSRRASTDFFTGNRFVRQANKRPQSL